MSPTIQSNINTIQFCSTSLSCAIHINDQISRAQKCTKEDSNRSNEIIHKKRKKTNRGKLQLPEPDPKTGKPLSLTSCIVYTKKFDDHLRYF